MDPKLSPLIIVLNHGSGHTGPSEREAAIAEVLDSAGRPYRLLKAARPSDLPKMAAQAVEMVRKEGGVVVAAGGDGTINTVVQAVLPSEVPFAVLPQGTFNYFGREQGVPVDPTEAVRALLDAELSEVQVGLINERAFVVNASIGAYPRLLENREDAKRRFGRSQLVAGVSGVATLLRDHRTVDLVIEHQGMTRSLRASTLFVGNNRLQLERVGLPESEAVTHGRLAAIAIKPVGAWAMFRLLVRGAIGELGEADNVVDFAFEKMRVQPVGRRRIKVATDGEVSWMKTPIEFRVAPKRLNMMVPRQQAPESKA